MIVPLKFHNDFNDNSDNSNEDNLDDLLYKTDLSKSKKSK